MKQQRWFRRVSDARMRGLGVLALCLSLGASPAWGAGAWTVIDATTAEDIAAALGLANSTRQPVLIRVAPGHYSFPDTVDTAHGPGVLPAVGATVTIVGADRDTTVLDANFGGRLLTVAQGGSLVLRRLTLTRGGFGADPVSQGGGALGNFGGFLRLDDCAVTDSSTGAENGAFGGAILSSNGRLHLERTRVTDSVVEGYGGGIAVVGGWAYLRDAIITGNEADSAFGSGGGGGLYVSAATVTLTRSTVAGNRASDDGTGGGIYNAGTLWVTHSAIVENAAMAGGTLGKGGGIHNAGTMSLIESSVAANTADTFGGGIFNRGRLYASGATVARNTVVGFVSSCDPSVAPCTGGGGIWIDADGHVRSQRSLLAENTIAPYDEPESVGADCAGTLLSDGFNAVGDASGCSIRRSYVLKGRTTHDLVGVDPRLGTLSSAGVAGDAHLAPLADSPLIDAGGQPGKDCPKFDQLGQPRRDGDGDHRRECDIGAIEFQDP